VSIIGKTYACRHAHRHRSAFLMLASWVVQCTHALRRGVMLAAVLLATSVSAHAVTYPLSVVDIAGRTVVLAKAPQRIYVQNGNDMMAMALLDREDPFARVVGWVNSLRNSDPSIWSVVEQRWPHAAQVLQLPFDNSGHVDLEALIRLRPDLVLLDIEAREAVEGGPVGDILSRLGVPALYLDSSRDPVVNVQKTVALLGQVLDREQRAAEYLGFYRQRLAALQAEAAREPHRPRVFIEVRAGRQGLEQCCYSQGKTAWGHLIAAVGGRNMASQMLLGETGDISLETLIRLKPDVYIMTGTQRIRTGARSIPFGYRGSMDEAQSGIAALMGRPGFKSVAPGPQACVHAFYHQFYDSAFNLVGMEYLAQALYPARFAGLSPDQTYRDMIARFTELPDVPFVFRARRGYGSDGACTDGMPAS
jgi:iron complex transport system substrate-binding protein